MIGHSVIFKFKNAVTEIEKQDFFEAAMQLTAIPSGTRLQRVPAYL